MIERRSQLTNRRTESNGYTGSSGCRKHFTFFRFVLTIFGEKTREYITTTATTVNEWTLGKKAYSMKDVPCVSVPLFQAINLH